LTGCDFGIDQTRLFKRPIPHRSRNSVDRGICGGNPVERRSNKLGGRNLPFLTANAHSTTPRNVLVVINGRPS
jgi:hypothetical protein